MFFNGSFHNKPTTPLGPIKWILSILKGSGNNLNKNGTGSKRGG